MSLGEAHVYYTVRGQGSTEGYWSTTTPHYMNPPAVGGDPAATVTTFGFYQFTGTGSNQHIAIHFILPRDYVEGTDVIPHIHWGKGVAAAGTATWEAKFAWANHELGDPVGWTGPRAIGDPANTPPETVTLAGGYIASTQLTDDNDTLGAHTVNEWAAQSGTGKTRESVFYMYMRRLGATDPYNSHTLLYGACLRYRAGEPGSLRSWSRHEVGPNPL